MIAVTFVDIIPFDLVVMTGAGADGHRITRSFDRATSLNTNVQPSSPTDCYVFELMKSLKSAMIRRRKSIFGGVGAKSLECVFLDRNSILLGGADRRRTRYRS